MIMDCSSLREQLMNDNAFFKKMVELIPSCYSLTETDVPTKIHPGSTAGKKCSRLLQQSLDKQDVLRESLHKKLEELKAKRTKPGAIADSIEKKRLKRKLSKQKLRQRRKAEKQKAGDLVKSAVEGKAKKSLVKTKPIFNSEGKMVFSKFDFSDGTRRKDSQKADVPTGKNYKALLEQAKKKQEKLAVLEKTDIALAKELSHKELWKAALSKAEGVKVRDNPELLKKALKKKQKQKEQSHRKWAAREENLSRQMKDRQDKRTKNIMKKKESRISKKMKRSKK
jgi:hypothetical protein